MGDLPPSTRPQALDSAAAGFARDENQGIVVLSNKSSEDTTPFHSQLSAVTQNQPRPDHPPSARSTMHHLPQEHGASPFNMSSMSGMLPEHGSVDEAPVNPQGSQVISRSFSGASTPAVVYQLGQNLQLPPHASGGMPNHPSYGNAYAANPYQQQALGQAPHHSHYPQFGANQLHMPTASMQTAYQNYPGPPQYMYYPAPYGHQGQYNPSYSAHGLQSQALYGSRGSSIDAATGLTGSRNMNYQHLGGGFSGAHANKAMMGLPFPRMQGTTQPGPISSITRGPPRKPKQSGHALWVGNLPPATTVTALKDHFSREATKDIESLFLISKSNCAFVNYRSEAACASAMHRFHDSRFNGVRLVCRLRRTSVAASGVPAGPSAGGDSASTPKVDIEITEEPQGSITEQSPQADGETAPASSTSPDRYFIVKSLTLQDLEVSVRTGIWSTQSHNEDILNKAFRSTANVFLIFSANKSGEYFGYARMTSPILEDGAQVVGSGPKTENIVDEPGVPRSIYTPATQWAPKGKIIDDSARGTIFWEAALPETEAEDEGVSEKQEKTVEGDNSVVAQSWGKPFKIEWCSTQRLSFYRTRGLRNPWNANREVKIARDGTELETSVGNRLVQMFHRLEPSATAASTVAPRPQFGTSATHSP